LILKAPQFHSFTKRHGGWASRKGRGWVPEAWGVGKKTGNKGPRDQGTKGTRDQGTEKQGKDRQPIAVLTSRVERRRGAVRDGCRAPFATRRFLSNSRAQAHRDSLANGNHGCISTTDLSKPAPANPARSNPAPSSPAPSDPAPANPAGSNPAASLAASS
jgi:hypothetical protein